MSDDHHQERDDPLWLGAWCLAAVSFVVLLMLILQPNRTPFSSGWESLLFLPMMAVGMAWRVRNESGNVTERVADVLARRSTTRPRRYRRRVALYLLGLYAFCVFVGVASYGLSAGVLGFVVLQGLVSVFVLTHTSWGAPPISHVAPDGAVDAQEAR